MHTNFNRFQLEHFSKEAADAFIKQDADLNTTIAKMASENQFTEHQINRVVENANIFVNGALVTKARSSGTDPRISFGLAKSASVNDLVNNPHRKTASDNSQDDFVQSLFTVEKRASAVDMDAMFGTMEKSPYETKSVNHVKLAADFIRGDAKVDDVTSYSISLASQAITEMRDAAQSDKNSARESLYGAGTKIASMIQDHILEGMSPATIRDVIAASGVNEETTADVNNMISKVASEIRTKEGKSAYCDKSIVNQENPLIKSAMEICVLKKKEKKFSDALSLFKEARASAREEYAKAVKGGR